MVIDEYQDALNYLYSFIDYGRTHAESLSPHKFDLERMERLMNALGDPHLTYRVVHVAGTKGKGSVCALCASAIMSAGYRVGLYTSPHLEDFCERIKIDNQSINPNEFTKCIRDLKPHIDKIPGITFFEITTAVAFYHFRNAGVEVAVVEVGLGGRLDATNIAQPLVSVITSISYDHTYVLGDTLSQIAGEKAGIIKEGVPVIMAPQTEDAHGVILKNALNRRAHVYDVETEILSESLNRELDGQRFRLRIPDNSDLYPMAVSGSESDDLRDVILSIPLLGDHQIENSAVAFATLVVLRTTGMSIDQNAIKTGFAAVEWPGRFEIYKQHPFIVLDSAHNKHSAGVLFQALNDYFPELRADLIFGASGDKNIRGMLEVLKPRIKRVIATRSSHPRAMKIHHIVTTCEQLDLPVTSCEDIQQALETAEIDSEESDLILVTGSLFVVGEARSILSSMNAADIDAEK